MIRSLVVHGSRRVLGVAIAGWLVAASAAGAQIYNPPRPTTGVPLSRAPRAADPSELTAKNLERSNPARVLRDRRKALGLTDEEMKALEPLARDYDDSAKVYAKAIDTLRKAMLERVFVSTANPNPFSTGRDDGPKKGADSVKQAKKDSVEQAKFDADEIRMQSARRGLDARLLALRAMHDSAAAKALPILTAEHRATSQPVFDDASEMLTAMLHWANVAPVQRVRRP